MMLGSLLILAFSAQPVLASTTRPGRRSAKTCAPPAPRSRALVEVATDAGTERSICIVDKASGAAELTSPVAAEDHQPANWPVFRLTAEAASRPRS